MRLAVINCITLALLAAALAEEPRPRRHLHQIKEMIINKLFSSSEPNCTQPTEAPPAPAPLETKFFRIPGFNNVVIKAVPKGSGPEPAPVYEEQELPPNSQIGIVGSYLGTRTLNETYNALFGVKNLLTSGILSAKRDVLQEITLPHFPKAQVIETAPSRLIKPCEAPGIGPLPVEPVRVIVRPPKVPVFPTQYSYKQVNQDGSLTSYTSALELGNGVRVIEDGRTVPFFIDRVQKIPVRLPVPVLPEVSKIIVSEAVHPSTYSYQQIRQDGRLTSYMGLPPLFNMPGPVVVTETVKRIPPPPVYLMDRIEEVAAIASFPRGPMINVASKSGITGHVPNAPVKGNPVPEPGPMAYSYSQMTVNGGTTTHSASGANAAVRVTENGLPAAPFNALPSLPEKNPFEPPRGYGFSYGEVHGGGHTDLNGLSEQAGYVNVIEYRPAPPSKSMPPNLFSYKQVGDGKMITYTGSGIIEENHGSNPTVVVHGKDHPVPPAHITDRIEKVAAGAMLNRTPFSTSFAIPIPTGFVRIPTVQTSVPQRPVKTPIPSRPSPFMYKHIHSDGSVTSYGSESLVEDGKSKLPPPADMTKPFPQGNVRVIESDYGPFPMNPVNANAIKPSTPVSGSYSYKMVNHPPVGPIDEPIVDTFAPPPPVPSMPAPIQGCIDPDVTDPSGYIVDPLARPAVLFEKPVPMTYSYQQISHSNPNPFLVVNVEDPVMDIKKVNMKLGHNHHAYQRNAPAPPSVNVVEHKPAFQPATYVTAPNVNIPVPQAPADTSPPSSFSYKQVTSEAHQPLPSWSKLVENDMDHRPNGFVPHQMHGMHMTDGQKDTLTPSPFSYKQVTSEGHQPLLSWPEPVENDMDHRPNGFAPHQMNGMRLTDGQKDTLPPSSFSYKQVTSEAHQPLPSWPQPVEKEMEHRPGGFVPPQMNGMRVTDGQKDTLPPSSFSYKQVTSEAHQPLPSWPQPVEKDMEHRPNGFVPHQMNGMRVTDGQKDTLPPPSFSYKQVTSEAHQPLPSWPQPVKNDMEHKPSATHVPPPMINSRGPQIQKDSVPSSFSYKHATRQGVYEYSDEFQTGVKTNLQSNPLHLQGNPSGDVLGEQKRPSNPSIPMTVPASPMPILSKPTQTFERRNSLSNNPIVVPEQSSFSFKSSNPDGSTITVKNDGHNSVAVQLEDPPKADAINSQEPAIPMPPAPIATEVQRTETAFVNEPTTAPVPEKETEGPVSGKPKLKRRRVLKRVKSVKQHRGDIPDTE